MRGQKNDARGWIRSNPRALVAAEEEQLVLAHRSPDYTAELVSFERIARGLGGIASIKISVSQELEQIAMNLVGAGFCHHIDHGAGMKPVAGRHRAHLNTELLYRIRKWNRRAYIGEQIIVAATVQQIKGAISRTSLDRNRNLSRIVLAPNRIRRRGRHRRPSELNQRCLLPSIQRQIEYTLVLEDSSDRVALRFDHPRVGLDLYDLHCSAHLQSYINRGVDVHLQHDSGLHVGAESRQAHLEPVGSDRQVRQCVGSRLVRNGASHQTRLGLRRIDFRSR